MFTANSLGYRWGGLIEWNIFQLPTIRARVAQAEAAKNAALAGYEKAVLLAFEDVHDSLMRYGKQGETVALLAATLKSREEAATIARARYEAGQEAFQPVIDSERQLAEARLQYTGAQMQLRLYLIQLHKALGGGWPKIPVD
jgi:outer membrane protein TolC